MSVLWNNLSTYLPWVSFVAGLGGSLHCVGMCGGLVTASCHSSPDVVRYQLGRLLGYLLLGLVAGALGTAFSLSFDNPLLSLLPTAFVGILFIYWGISSLWGIRLRFPNPKFMNRLYQSLWKKLVFKNATLSRSFFVGLISIMLPCGLLYGVILGALSLQNFSQALVAVTFFWLGTVPSMVLAPGIMQKIIAPFKLKSPKVYGLTLVLIGVSTLGVRAYNFTHKAQVKAPALESKPAHTCH